VHDGGFSFCETPHSVPGKWLQAWTTGGYATIHTTQFPPVAIQRGYSRLVLEITSGGSNTAPGI